jgi:hypothetical protein
MHDATAQDAR